MPTLKPLPRETEASSPFWNALREKRVCIQQCRDCDAWVFYPRFRCNHCLSSNLVWRDIPGMGTLYTYTISRLPTLPEFTDEMPQILAVVQLDEGPHLNSTVVGLKPDDIKVGMRLRPVFDIMDETGATLLRFTGIDTVINDKAPLVITEEKTVVPNASALVRRKVRFDDLDAMTALVSENFSGWSNDVLVDQSLINRFAELSGDNYWIHTDPDRARKDGPFGTTIAHGSLVQILQSRLQIPLEFEVVGFSNMLNYGSDRLRFPSPVISGSRIHGRSRVKSVEKVKNGTRLTLELNIHVVGNDKPAAINDLVILYM